jgi:predicted nucleic acid-binding protein
VNVGLDTSVLLRLLVGEPADQFKRAEAFLNEIVRRGDQAVVSDLVLSEVYFALQHHYGVSKYDALSFLRDAFDSGDLKPLGSALDVLKTPGLATAKPGFIDRLIHAEYLETVDEVVTFEKASAKLKATRVL